MERKMAALKKTSILLALMFMVLAFTPTANAQQPLGVISCSATPVTPLVRAEGVSEAGGDIDILCTNTPGVSVNVVQYLPTNLNVLANNTNFTNSIGLVAGGVVDLTEAVVIINSNHSMLPSATSDVPPTGGDEPDSRFPGPQYMELTGDTVLTANKLQFPVPGAPNDGEWEPGDDLADCLDGGSDGEGEPGGFGDTGGDACFPTTTTIKIGNIRVNASALAAPSQVSVTVSMTGETNIPIFPNVLNIALPLVGLTWGVTSGGVGLQCSTDSLTATVSLHEGFATSFKTLGAPTFIPGNTQVESGYFSPGGGATQATRFKIWFLNVPNGVGVSVLPSVNNAAEPETQDCSAEVNLDGDALCLHLITGADAYGAGGGATPFSAGAAVAVSIDSDGMGMVVYEVTDANPFATEWIDIGVKYSWLADTANDEPTPGTTQIRVNFAPIATSFVADKVSPRPRFIDTGGAPLDAASIRRCTTTLLYPWISNQAGFDTGVVVSNTSADWLGTPHQLGSCTVHWHGAEASGPLDAGDDTTSAVINAGEQFVFLVSNEAPGFQGYIIIVCDFQFAHGFAYLSDGFTGVPTQAQGYLALILEDYDKVAPGKRVAPETLGQ